jgi:hypothetical protein
MSIPGLSDSPEATMLGRAMGVREQEEERAKRAAEEEKIARVLAKEQEQQRRQAESDARAAAGEARERERHENWRNRRDNPEVKDPKPVSVSEARALAEVYIGPEPEDPEQAQIWERRVLARQKALMEGRLQRPSAKPRPAAPAVGAARPALQQQQFPASVRIGGRSVPWAQVPPDIQAEVMQRMGAQ